MITLYRHPACNATLTVEVCADGMFLTCKPWRTALLQDVPLEWHITEYPSEMVAAMEKALAGTTKAEFPYEGQGTLGKMRSLDSNAHNWICFSLDEFVQYEFPIQKWRLKRLISKIKRYWNK